MICLQYYAKGLVLLLLSASLTKMAVGQAKPALSDSLKLSKLQKQKPEIFTSGFLDIMNSGQVNAAARFIRL